MDKKSSIRFLDSHSDNRKSKIQNRKSSEEVPMKLTPNFIKALLRLSLQCTEIVERWTRRHLCNRLFAEAKLLLLGFSFLLSTRDIYLLTIPLR